MCLGLEHLDLVEVAIVDSVEVRWPLEPEIARIRRRRNTAEQEDRMVLKARVPTAEVTNLAEESDHKTC